jgi:hypothetical protein
MDKLEVMIVIQRTDTGACASAMTNVGGVDYIVKSGDMPWGADAAELALSALLVQITPSVHQPMVMQEDRVSVLA